MQIELQDTVKVPKPLTATLPTDVDDYQPLNYDNSELTNVKIYFPNPPYPYGTLIPQMGNINKRDDIFVIEGTNLLGVMLLG